MTTPTLPEWWHAVFPAYVEPYVCELCGSVEPLHACD